MSEQNNFLRERHSYTESIVRSIIFKKKSYFLIFGKSLVILLYSGRDNKRLETGFDFYKHSARTNTFVN